MTNDLRTRCSWIPVFARDDSLLLRLEPDWGQVWYWPSVSDDDAFRSAPAFLDAVCAELRLERASVFASREPFEVREYFEEVVRAPTGTRTVYQFRLVDMSRLADRVTTERPGEVSGRLHQWASLQGIFRGEIDGKPVQPEVASLWTQWKSRR